MNKNAFYKDLKSNMKNRQVFEVKDIYPLYPSIKEKTIGWRLHSYVKEGLLYRVGHGKYSFVESRGSMAPGYDYLHKQSKRVYDILQEFGFNYYISGLDALVGELHHVPENYPILLVVEKNDIGDIRDNLRDEGYFAVNEKELIKNDLNDMYHMIDIVILSGNTDILSLDGIAIKEKAFVDLYYMVTRMNYGFSLQELYRVFDSLKRNKMIFWELLKKAGKDRRISTEINWLAELSELPSMTLDFMWHQIEEERNERY